MITTLILRVTAAPILPLLLLWSGVVLAGSPPAIRPSTTFQHQSVALGSNLTFTVSVTGDPPLTFQWKLAAADLAGSTNRALAITNAQPSDEGDYTVVVSNAEGALTSAPVRLYVVPPSTTMVKGNYTNAASLRLPYFYHLPIPYDPQRRYPLAILMHGTPGDENTIPQFLASYSATMVLASYHQQATDPVILVWPTRRAGNNDWTEPYLRQVSGLIDQLIADFSVDTNRICIAGGSEGVHAAWDLVGMRPSFFASMWLAAGWSGVTQARFIKDVPAWIWCASDDSLVGDTRSLVGALRSAGGKPIYTEYASGGHYEGIFMGMRTPVVMDWVLAQRRGDPGIHEPLLSIARPTSESTLTTGASVVSLAGQAEALGQPVTSITWRNLLSGQKGSAQGTNDWSVSNIPLRADRTNTVEVTATTTSWSAGYRGNTTFSDTISILCSPIRATLALQGPGVILSWTNGVPPFAVQRATDLGPGDWTVLLTNAIPPLTVPLDGEVRFYRVLGQ